MRRLAAAGGVADLLQLLQLGGSHHRQPDTARLQVAALADVVLAVLGVDEQLLVRVRSGVLVVCRRRRA